VVDGKVAFMGSQNMIDSSYLKRANIKVGALEGSQYQDQR
jgi:cardiolipin synthase A/B